MSFLEDYLSGQMPMSDEPVCPNCNDEGCEFCGPDYESDYDDYDDEESSDYDDYDDYDYDDYDYDDYDYDDRRDDYDAPW